MWPIHLLIRCALLINPSSGTQANGQSWCQAEANKSPVQHDHDHHGQTCVHVFVLENGEWCTTAWPINGSRLLITHRCLISGTLYMSLVYRMLFIDQTCTYSIKSIEHCLSLSYRDKARGQQATSLGSDLPQALPMSFSFYNVFIIIQDSFANDMSQMTLLSTRVIVCFDH